MAGDGQTPFFIHSGSVENDLNDPRGAKTRIEFTMALVYQKEFLIMSKHAEKLTSMYSYPVIEVYLDNDWINDPEHARILNSLFMTLHNDSSYLKSMQVIPIVYLWRETKSQNDFVHSDTQLGKLSRN
jgi:hypothetical protein